MTLSVVIPRWSGTPELAKMALGLCQQVRPMCDQLIVTEDGDYSQPIEGVVDVYLKNHPRLGHARNTARGVASASGDYIGILDSDVSITKGTLRDLCVPNRAASGVWKDWPLWRGLIGWCFVVDRTLVERYPIGYAEWEGLGLWMADLNLYGVHVDGFEYSHLQAQSYKELLRLGGTIESIQTREVVIDRHRSRINEDSIYRAKWENES